MRTLDLLTAGTPSGAVTRVYGSADAGAIGRRGVPVAGGFDCDGDGFADTAFAGIQSSPLGRTGAGEVLLVFGDGTLGGQVDTAGFSSNVLKIAGDQTTEVAGAEIWMDDVTGDGLGDLLICRQNYTPTNGRPGAGALTILKGGPELREVAQSLSHLDLRAPTSSVTLATVTGDRAYDRLGIWVRTGDVTGDGLADIAVGADQVDGAGETNRGAVYVIRGGAHLAVTRTVDLSQFGATALSGQVARVFPPAGLSANYHFGATVQLADLDGNGRAELLSAAALNRAGAGICLAGTPAGECAPSGGAPHGKLFVTWDDNFPSNLWPAAYTVDAAVAPGGRTIITGHVTDNDAFGEEMIGGLDFDGDGHADLFAGDLTGDGINGINSGIGHVFYDAAQLKQRIFSLDAPPPEIRITVIEGPVSGAIGADTVAQGDFDADGLGDLAFGNPHDAPKGRENAGTVHVLYGEPGGWPAVVDLSVSNMPGPDVMRILRIEGAHGAAGAADRGDTLCYSGAAGDLDGDGRTDLIINEMVGNGLAPGSEDVGNLLLIGGAALLDPPPDIQTLTAPGGNLVVTFSALTNRTYFLQSADELSALAWSNVLTGLDGVDGQISITNPASAPFLRVGQE